MTRQRIRIEEGEGAIEVCLSGPPTPELEEALRAIVRAVQVDVRQPGRAVVIGGVQEQRIIALQRRAGRSVWPDPGSDD